MEKLKLLFTKDGLQYQTLRNKTVTAEHIFLNTQEQEAVALTENLKQILGENKFSEINVISAINHFALTPEGFQDHNSGYDLIAFNAQVDREKEELMLAINKKFGVQFYYTFPKESYQLIKETKAATNFNFSGSKFLDLIAPKNQKEIHINLYNGQCEFLALDKKQLMLYNNLDVTSEVDFLYFIMFTLSKIGFGTDQTQFFVYGETVENETFISELQKFVRSLKIVFDNIPHKNFVLS